MISKELNMKNCNLVAYLLLASAVTTFSNSVAVRADTLGKSHLIAQSRRQYECSRNGVQPSISGAIYRDGNCFIPISAGKCIAYSDPFGYSNIVSSGPSGMTKCNNPEIVDDEATGKKYYKFFSGEKFILVRRSGRVR
ncbi:MAG: hypothetical protein ACKPGN_10230 [Dolichospermum sp.]